LIGELLLNFCFYFSAVNAENNEINKIKNQSDGSWGGVPDVARDYKKKGIRWVTVGDENYGKLSMSKLQLGFSFIGPCYLENQIQHKN